VGDAIKGQLKSAAKDIKAQIKATPGGELLRAVQAKYARARTTYDSLSKLLKDEGNAEQMLENVFKSQAPRYKTIRRGLADLEKLSGEPVFTRMFQEFAAKSLNKYVGKSGRASVGATLMASGAGTTPFNPMLGIGQMAAGAGLAASQSPKVLSRALPLVKGAGAVGGGAAGGVAGYLMSLANKARQSSQPKASY
jgi:hypothetical protein